MAQTEAFDTRRAETRLERQNYRCEVQDGMVIVQDPWHSRGIIVGYDEVVLRSDNDLTRFFAARS